MAQPEKRGHFIVGNDGGINITYDNGANYFKMNNIPVGQFYAIAIDSAKPYNVYGGLQDNGVWRGNSQNVVDKSWQEDGEYPLNRSWGAMECRCKWIHATIKPFIRAINLGIITA